MKSKARRKKETIKIRVKNQWLRKQKNNREKSMKPQACSLRRSINVYMSCKTDQEKREKIQIIDIRNMRSDTTTDSTDIKSIITEYYEQL